jgi:hypothetical protein
VFFNTQSILLNYDFSRLTASGTDIAHDWSNVNYSIKFNDYHKYKRFWRLNDCCSDELRIYEDLPILKRKIKIQGARKTKWA